MTGSGRSLTKGRDKGMRRAYGLVTRQERLKARYHRINEDSQVMHEDPGAPGESGDPAPIEARADEVRNE